MDVVFERTGWRSYAIEVVRPDRPALRMDPAPGFDEWFPHDLQHLVVEEQLGLHRGIFGRLAMGGDAGTFRLAAPDGPVDKRTAARRRRRSRARDRAVAGRGDDDFGRSERATYVAWHDWLTHADRSAHRTKAAEMEATAASIVDRMESSELRALIGALPRLRDRIEVVAREWNGLEPGGAMVVRWAPVR